MRISSHITAIVALSIVPTGVFAVGGDDTSPPTPTETTVECEDGQVWDKKKKKCVDPEGAQLDDDALYGAARELAYDGQYDNAITVLSLAANSNDPRILNYLGFAHRKAGRVKIGMKYYREALRLDPNYVLARSYMGQSLLLQGKRDQALEQLAEIQARGGAGTWAEQALILALRTPAQILDY